MDNKDILWKELETKHLIKDQWIDLMATSYEMPDGQVWEPFYTYHKPDYCIIVAEDEEGSFPCVMQFRQGIRDITTEFPAGGIEDGEDPLLAAKRELLEETGYESDDWTFLMKIPSHATIADNYAYIYQAKNCRKVSGQELDPTEFVRIVSHTADEISQLIAEGKFQQAIHILAWKMCH